MKLLINKAAIEKSMMNKVSTDHKDSNAENDNRMDKVDEMNQQRLLHQL